MSRRRAGAFLFSRDRLRESAGEQPRSPQRLIRPEGSFTVNGGQITGAVGQRLIRPEGSFTVPVSDNLIIRSAKNVVAFTAALYCTKFVRMRQFYGILPA